MNPSKKMIWITRQSSAEESIEETLLKKAGFEVVKKPILDEEELIRAGNEADGIIAGSREPFNRRVIGAIRRCRIISRYGIGYDNIDVRAATEKNIIVTNVPDGSSREVADHTISLILTLARKIPVLDEAVKNGEWAKRRAIMQGMRQLSRLTVGIIGFGRIGRQTWRRAQALGMNALVYDRYIDPDFIRTQGAIPASFDEIISTSDFVVLHMPGSETPVITAEILSMMKKSAYLINCSRGNLVDEAALIAALEKGQIAGAGLDVLAKEPPDPDNPLLKFPNVVVTGHSAFFSEDSEELISTETAQAMIDLFSGKLPKNIVNPEVADRIALDSRKGE